MWQCPICQTNYENSVIEHMLIDALNRKTMAFVLQDIQCKKCLQVSCELEWIQFCYIFRKLLARVDENLFLSFENT